MTKNWDILWRIRTFCVFTVFSGLLKSCFGKAEVRHVMHALGMLFIKTIRFNFKPSNVFVYVLVIILTAFCYVFWTDFVMVDISQVHDIGALMQNGVLPRQEMAYAPPDGKSLIFFLSKVLSGKRLWLYLLLIHAINMLLLLVLSSFSFNFKPCI